MSIWLAILVGFVAGGIFGIFIMSVVAMGRDR